MMSAESSSSNGSSGRYRIEGNWLILNRDDGIEARQYIYTIGPPLGPGEKLEFINIGDSLYSLE